MANLVLTNLETGQQTVITDTLILNEAIASVKSVCNNYTDNSSSNVLVEAKTYADSVMLSAITNILPTIPVVNYPQNSGAVRLVVGKNADNSLKFFDIRDEQYIQAGDLLAIQNSKTFTLAEIAKAKLELITQINNSYDSSLYSQVDTVGSKLTAYYKAIAYRLKYIYNNYTLFEEYTSFRIPTEVGFGTGYSFTDSSNYEWSFRERNSNTSTPLLQFKTTAGVKSIVAPYKIQASGWTASTNIDLTTKGSVDTAINSSLPVGSIILFVRNVNSGLLLPTGWLQCNGSTFSSTTYPDLFLARSSTTLPNLTAPSGAYYIIKALKTSS